MYKMIRRYSFFKRYLICCILFCLNLDKNYDYIKNIYSNKYLQYSVCLNTNCILY